MGRRWVALGSVVAAVAVAAVGTASSVTAGGWAVTEVDRFEPPVAGEELEIGFTILQHGRTPVDVDGVVIIVDDQRGDIVQFAAKPEGTIGRYRATIEFPSAGRYRWSVVQGWFGPQDLSTLDIAGRSASSSNATWVVAPIGAVIAGAAGTLAWRARRGVPGKRSDAGDDGLGAQGLDFGTVRAQKRG